MARTQPINLTHLYSALGFKVGQKLPLDYQGEHTNVACLDRGGNTVVTAKVRVKPGLPGAKGAVKHRVFVVCPHCTCEIPFGRYHQHAGTKSCEKKRQKVADQQTALLHNIAVGHEADLSRTNAANEPV